MASAATVFGLDVSADVQLSFLQDAHATATGRPLEITVATEPAQAPIWPESAELVCDQRLPDGTVNFRIQAHPEAGYLIWGPTYGGHRLSRDGRSALCMPEDQVEAAWQRMLIAQVLPFAAVLQGLEVLHASAVTWKGGAVAFVGPSRAGKTSIAVELCRRGSGFLADDVLALECSGEQLLGHPGTPLAGVDHAEAQRLSSAGDPSVAQAVATNERERLVPMGSAAGPVPLRALFLLERRPDGPSRPHFEPAADPKLLLANTFNSVLTQPERLLRLFEVSALAARHPIERVLAGPEVQADQLASAVERRLGAHA